MKTTYLPNIKLQKKKKKFILMGALIAFIILIIIFWNFSFRFISRPIFYFFRPLINFKVRINNSLGKIEISLKEKEKLQKENYDLREENMQLKTKVSSLGLLEKENNELKNAFFSDNKREFMPSSIISRPPQTPYDMIIIDSGSNDGIKEGAQVLAFDNVLLGHIADVFSDMSKVKLISAFSEENNVLLESSGVSTIAVGRGGENFEIILPRAVSVDIGERIIYLGENPLLVGIVERIEQQITDPFQKIIFRLPVNINYLNRVFLLKK